MYNPDFTSQFEPYLDPETWLDDEGHIVDWKDRKLIKNAPQSAIDAFNEFKKLEAETNNKI